MDYIKLSEMLFPEVTASEEEIEARYPQRTLPEGAVVSRMAPSPTGFVHLGNLVQGLTSERLCHQSGGVLFLRIDDTDDKRRVPGAVEQLITMLSHYDIRFDEGASLEGDIGEYGPYSQQQRRELYHVFAKRLVREGKAYPCFCDEQTLTENHAQQERNKENFGYYGKYAVWRDRPMEDIQQMLDQNAPWVLRFRSTGSIENKIKFTDLIKGSLELTENDIDYVLLKSDGIPTYHFAHVVDDHLMRTTHVVRGDEWLATLPVHLQLFAALGFKPPKFLHIGALMKMDGESKRKLSKRKDPELALTYYDKQGYPTESVYEYMLTVLNSNFEDWRRANPDAAVGDFKFSPKKMNPAGSLFDNAKLDNVSKNVISRFTSERLVQQLTEWAEKHDKPFAELLCDNKQMITEFFAIGRGGKKPRKDIAKLSECKDFCSYMFDALYTPSQEFPENITREDVTAILGAYTKGYSPLDEQDAWFEKVKSICAPLGFSPDVKAYREQPEQYRGHVGDVSTVIRVALTGRTNTPDLCSIMRLLGQQRVTERIAHHIGE